MNLTIINGDKAVYVDGVSYLNLPLTSIPVNVHALQWNVDKGWIEYNDGQINEEITVLPTWANDSVAEYDLKVFALAEEAAAKASAA
jgi:hypothetical protein